MVLELPNRKLNMKRRFERPQRLFNILKINYLNLLNRHKWGRNKGLKAGGQKKYGKVPC